MSSIMTIALSDKNTFFIKGLQDVLAQHFNSRGVLVRIVDIDQVSEADLVFRYFSPGNLSCFCQYELPPMGRKPLYFTLRQPDKRHSVTASARCVLESGVIRHDMPVSSALQVVIAGLERQRLWPLDSPSHKRSCGCQRILTLREQEIMRCMKWELGVTQIAHMLDISVKTVSNHKMSVMRKMGFRRNAELYGWLRRSTRAQL
ncbi:Putative transcription factor YjjQ [Serratia quinivorans]|uniref:Response regulator transcription factor n=1 Tax=Serratia quinivorans TaxID=137545 RepID=A0ABV3UMN0_9GAMM|nr:MULTISPECIES: helix-turn-helix transcriptional regulator [Serratia]CAI1879581.1 Putative transcription factor YjjQ [Serratia quinivorans]CAI1895113.1 Putative transcription factor YjjQ [Serratia quinivorans]